jgi:putative PIN family toxin of toxin-antitoxin system
MITAVYDTMTYLQAATNCLGPAGACFALVDDDHVKLFLSKEILEEVRAVLSRPGIRKAFRTLTDEIVQDFLDHVVETAHLVENVPSIYHLERDPDDEPHLNLAIASKASFLVSRDKDLLQLMHDVAFRKAYPELAIIEPTAFLKHVRTEVAKKQS